MSAGAIKMPVFFQVAYHRKTLAELLYLRDRLKWRTNDVDCMIAGYARHAAWRV